MSNLSDLIENFNVKMKDVGRVCHMIEMDTNYSVTVNDSVTVAFSFDNDCSVITIEHGDSEFIIDDDDDDRRYNLHSVRVINTCMIVGGDWDNQYLILVNAIKFIDDHMATVLSDHRAHRSEVIKSIESMLD